MGKDKFSIQATEMLNKDKQTPTKRNQNKDFVGEIIVRQISLLLTERERK